MQSGDDSKDHSEKLFARISNVGWAALSKETRLSTIRRQDLQQCTPVSSRLDHANRVNNQHEKLFCPRLRPENGGNQSDFPPVFSPGSGLRAPDHVQS